MGASLCLRLAASVIVASGRRAGVAWGVPSLSSSRRRGLAASSSESCPLSWESLGLGPALSSAAAAVWERPNVVQSSAIVEVLKGADVVIGAETGSGKTLAYLLPMVESIGYGAPPENDSSRRYPSALVLVPNRELGTQLQRVAQSLGGDTMPPYASDDAPFSIGSKYGGESKALWPFRPGECPDILVSTPSFVANFDRDLEIWGQLRCVVLDEADALLDGGSKRQLDRILVALKRVERARQRAGELAGPRCQRIVVAATLPTFGLKSVESLVAKSFDNATRVAEKDGSPLPMHAPVASLRQEFVQVEGDLDDKLEACLDVLVPGERTMLFANTARAVDAAVDFLDKRQVKARAYHKRVHPNERIAVLDAFAAGDLEVLCCTDLAARGLDLPDVAHVVQLEFATDAVAHLHRVGRAARNGNPGRATNIYDDRSKDLLDAIDDESRGSVANAFSRRRGFRQKLKKAAKRQRRG